MKMVRTPDARFENLPGYGFRPNYLEVDDGEGGKLRMHHVSEGPAAGPVVLLLHGEPSWSYLYRKMIPPLAAAGCRVVAPDLVGFGRSDKPTQRSDYTYARHVAWVWSCIEQLGLEEITLVCQDWGSLIGLRIAAEHPARFSRIVVGNGGLPTGDAAMSPAFLAWQKYSQKAPVFPAGAIVSRACANKLAPDVIAAYDAPFPDEAYKEGARQFPLLVPCSPGDSGLASQSPGVGCAQGLAEALPDGIQRQGSRHRRRGRSPCRSSCRAPAARRTRRSGTRVTFCKKTRARSSRRSCSTS